MPTNRLQLLVPFSVLRPDFGSKDGKYYLIHSNLHHLILVDSTRV